MLQKTRNHCYERFLAFKIHQETSFFHNEGNKKNITHEAFNIVVLAKKNPKSLSIPKSICSYSNPFSAIITEHTQQNLTQDKTCLLLFSFKAIGSFLDVALLKHNLNIPWKIFYLSKTCKTFMVSENLSYQTKKHKAVFHQLFELLFFLVIFQMKQNPREVDSSFSKPHMKYKYNLP